MGKCDHTAMTQYQICVYCGSSSGALPALERDAQRLGQRIGAAGHGLVYGGAAVGLMGALANAALAADAPVVGVLPETLGDREVAHPGLTRLEIVPSMHLRKARMAELADGFIALPGGLGTLEELFEMLTWAQLGLHDKPITLLNSGGYFDALLTFLDQAVRDGFVRPAHRRRLLVAETADEALATVMSRSAGAPTSTTPTLGSAECLQPGR